MELYGCLKLSVPKNVATKEPVDLHFHYTCAMVKFPCIARVGT